ncbi:MAG: sigma-70 family RNA polymerase sigma factor [Planctomycetes bacterium]|nr:sigma-70 family RNA polymerase sigma factor [Planctomycetota bacterium]
MGGTQRLDWDTTSTNLDGLRDYGNADAWGRLAGRFRQPIVGFALQLGLTAADAEDVAQETLTAFADAYRNGGYDPTRGALSRWLFGIAYRQALKERRLAARQRAGGTGAPSALWAQVPDQHAASESWDQEWEQAILGQCLEQVAREVEPATYQAFEMAVTHQRSAADVAATLGMPVKAVYNAKHRVLKRIRELRAQWEQVA